MAYSHTQYSYQQYLQGGKEMGELTRSFDWSSTVLGYPASWSQSLLTTVSTILRSKFPMFLWWGPDLIQFYNDAYRPSLGNEGKHPMALGQPGAICWPEIWPVIKPLIDQVISGGESTWSEDQLIPIYRNNRLEDVYWTFSYSSVIDESGAPGGVLVICSETTEKVNGLAKLNEAKKDIEQRQAETERQRDRLNNFFMQAPAGICILDGPDLTFELVNPTYQQFFPGRTLAGKPLLEVLPELENQPVWNILQDVYYTNTPFEGKEMLIPLARAGEGTIEERYFNFTYTPRLRLDTVDGIVVVAFEVTDLVHAKRDLESARDTLKLSLQAAELGTFDMDLLKGTMNWDDRCRTLFGIKHKETVTYEKDFVNGLHPDDRARITTAIKKVFIKAESQGEYDVEYRTVGVEDQKVRWIRAKGKAYFNKNDVPVRFIGAVLEITEQKTDEIRKNDFIGMVSHELKTPLTSLTAIIQVLLVKLKNSEDRFVTKGLDKAFTQVKKMNRLIHGFLNISRFESGKIHIQKQSFALNELIYEIIDQAEFTFHSHKIEPLNCKPVRVFADHDKIGSVISNFLNNAMKYSPKDSPIQLQCREIDGQVQVSVKDNGIGIKPENLEKLFERYYRVENNEMQHISGFGIGLYLSAEIIELHGGRIWVESEAGVGSTFYFSLPIDLESAD